MLFVKQIRLCDLTFVTMDISVQEVNAGFYYFCQKIKEILFKKGS